MESLLLIDETIYVLSITEEPTFLIVEETDCLYISVGDVTTSYTIVPWINAADVIESASRVFVSPSEKTAITHSNRAALDLVSGVNTGDQTKASLGLDIVLNKEQKIYHGFLDRSSSNLSFVSGTRTFTLSNVSGYVFYVGGTKFTSSSNKTVVIGTGLGNHFVSLNSSGDLISSQTPWIITDETYIPVATIHWDGSTGIIGDERHSYNRNLIEHRNQHDSWGAQYVSGFTPTPTFGPGATNTFSFAGGVIRDEDIYHTMGTQTQCMIGYRVSGAASMTFEAASTAYAKLNAGISRYDNNGTLTDLVNNQYGIYWIFATNRPTTPIVSIMGQGSYANIAAAQAAPMPTLPGLSVAEWKLLYRVIVRRTAGNPFAFIQTDVMYNISTGPAIQAGTPSVVSAGQVTFAPFGNIASANVQGALEELDTEKAGVSQTFYIGTTQVAIDRASAALTLAGITLTTPNIGVATGTSFNSITGLASADPLMNGTAVVGTSTLTARQDHVHPSDTSRSPVAGPGAGQAFTVGALTATTLNGFGTSQSGGNSKILVTDASGNLGLVAPSAWGSSVFKAFELGSTGNYIAGYVGGNSVSIGVNAYYNGSAWVYARTSAAPSLQYEQRGNGRHVWCFKAGGTVNTAINFTEYMTLMETGNLLINTTTDDGVSKLQVNGVIKSVTSGVIATFSGNANGSYIQLYKDGTPSYVAGIGTSTAGNGAAVSALTFSDYQGSWVERMRLDSSGNLLVGVTSGTHNIIFKNTPTDGTLVCSVYGGGNNGFVVYGSSDSTGIGNAANAQIKVGKASTGRSINTVGTINASGADYAEYEYKSDTCNDVIKGQVVGFDIEGKLTDKWSEAFSFGVKTTNPSYVGGDTWGSEELVGKRPEQPAEDAEQLLKDQYVIDLADFEARLGAERQKVDRIAYSGKVPCNVDNAIVGDYIIAVQDGEAIKGIAVKTPTFEQYQKAVGRVRRILPDGRPEIAVIIH